MNHNMRVNIFNLQIPIEYIFLVIAIVAAIIFFCILAQRFQIPFDYPKIRCEIDISGKRTPSYQDYIDQWIINNKDVGVKSIFNELISAWECEAEQRLKNLLFWKKYKTKIYKDMRKEVVRGEKYPFVFIFFRMQTRYRQQNYQKEAYKVRIIEHTEERTLREMLSIDKALQEIGYETTREKYFSKEQRKLMTKELRHKVIVRDNYTCQICGKYMPDEVGLHVDHIVAIKNGGKTVESNLQVLCDKCNLGKGAKAQGSRKNV